MACEKCNRDTAVNSKLEEFCKGCGMLIRACKCKKLPEKISIIIPCYNAENFINDAVKNVLRQDYENYEVILVDDGSTDKTLVNLLRDPLSDKIKIIEKENGGVGSALNAGIKEMSGEWFKWLSADDMLEPNCLSKMMETINETPDNHDKIFYTHYTIIDKDNKIDFIFEEKNRNNLSYLEKCANLYHLYYGNATTCMFHKSVFDRVGMFDESLKNGDDYDFWLRAMLGNKIELHLIPENLASYRKHDSQLTKRRGAELFKTIEEIRKNNLKLLPEELQEKIVKLSKELDNQPIKVKARRKVRNIIFSIMPNKFNNKLLSTYQDRKKT